MDPQAPAPEPAPESQPVTTSPTPDAVVEAPAQPTEAFEPAPAGAPAPTPTAHTGAENPGHGLGIAGLVVTFFAPLIGLILSIVALSKSKKAGMSNGMAVGGIILSSIFMLVGLIFIVIFVMAGVALNQKCQELGPGVHYENGTTYDCPL